MKGLIKRSHGNNGSITLKNRWPKGIGLSQVLPEFRHDMDIAFDHMRRNMQAMWSKPTMTWPALDVQEDEHSMTIRVDAPGVDPKNLDVELSGNLLTIRGARESQRKESTGSFRYQERMSGSFYRTVPLPDYVDAAKVEARYDKGVLNIRLPKVPGHGRRRITVSS